MMTVIADNQLTLLVLFFVAGCLGTAVLFRKPAGHRAWRLADLVWVVLGGFGALVAVLAGIYSADHSRLDRQIDLAYAASTAFDRDAARFRLRFCETPSGPDLAVLCEKVEFLSASTAANAELPLFIALTEAVAPLQGLHVLPLGSDSDAPDMPKAGGDMRQAADAFDPERFLVFAALDDPTRAALARLQEARPGVAGDFRILAQSYQALIARLGRLKAEWDYLQANAHILVLQILALCLVSFAAPFRLGKSLVELR